VGHPAEDQNRREHHVQNHGGRLHDHARLEVAGPTQRGAHRRHRELQRHRRDEPEEVLAGERRGSYVGAENANISRAQTHADREKDQTYQDGQHERLIEGELSAIAILLTRGVRHERGDAHPQHLRDREHDEGEVARDTHAGDRLLAEAADPVKVHEKVQRLKDHRDQHEAGRLQQMSRDGPRSQILHSAMVVAVRMGPTAAGSAAMGGRSSFTYIEP